jgi:mannose-6-phosphate isomerase-like protein (cupin superfamily)
MSNYEPLEVINLDKLSNEIQEIYKNLIINQVNDSCLRMAVFTGEYPWHFHASSDEMFMVLEGELIIEFKDRETVHLKPHEIITIPAGVIHRTRSTLRTVNLCFELLEGDTTFVNANG